MYAFLFTLVLFSFWFLVGFATLSLWPPKLRVIQGILIAPTVGFVIMLLFVFCINRAGVPVKNFSGLLVLVLLALSLFILVIKRPILPIRRVFPFMVVLLLALFLAGWPMFRYGFDWLSFSNDDMANYCLAAQRFLNHGYFDLPNTADLLSGRDYSLFYWFMHVADKMRSGSELMLAALWGATTLNAHQLFMPCMMALFLSLISATGALVSNCREAKKAPLIAMSLLATSPLTTLGVLYQLIAQVGGLSLLCTAVVLLYRSINLKKAVESTTSAYCTDSPSFFDDFSPHRMGDTASVKNHQKNLENQHISHSRYDSTAFFRMKSSSFKYLLSQNILPALVFSAIFIWYPEVLPFLGIGWLLFVGFSKITGATIKSFLMPMLVISLLSLLFLNNYLFDALDTMFWQSTKGMHPVRQDEILFPFFMMPSGIPELFGLLPIVNNLSDPFMSLVIGFGLILFVWCFCCTIKQARRLYPGAIIALLMFVLSAVLFYRNIDFGLYKLAMYLQPFLAAVVAVELSRGALSGRWKIWLLASIVVIAAVITQHNYVIRSTGEDDSSGFVEIGHASSEQVNRQFEHLMQSYPDKDHQYFFSDTSNVVLAKFQALYTQRAHIYFVARDIFDRSVGMGKRSIKERYRSFVLSVKQEKSDQFKQAYLSVGDKRNLFAVASMRHSPKHTSWISSPRSSIFNVLHHPSDKKNAYYDVIKTPQNHLVFINSKLGPHYYLSDNKSQVAFYQLEQDPMFPGQYMSGLGRYLLFMMVGSSPKPRVMMEISATLMKQFGSHLPEPSLFGAHKTRMAFVGRGSGRLISEPIEPALIQGTPYVNVDMERVGAPFSVTSEKSGFMRLYGNQILLDARRLTVFGRDISLLSEDDYQSMKPPSKLEQFPKDLANKQLEYSGIYEDGWISEQSFFILAPKVTSTTLLIRGMVPQIDDPAFHTQLIISLGGKIIKEKLNLGSFEIKLPIAITPGKQRIELVFTRSQRLPGKDGRITGGKLAFIGFV